MVKKVPLQVSGVMLGMAALGHLLQSYGGAFRVLCGVLAAFLFCLVLCKLIMHPGMIRQDLKDPVLAGFAATYPMGMMVLSAQCKSVFGKTAYYLWLLAIALQIALIVYYSMRFVKKKLDLRKVSTVWYIVYVGIACAGVTASAFGKHTVGAVAFWLGLIAFLPLLYFVNQRYAKIPAPESMRPLIGICAMPMSLCAAAYVQSAKAVNLPFLLTMLAIATVLYVYAFAKVFEQLKAPFEPNCAAYTFPFVISALATKLTMTWATNAGHELLFLKPVVHFETAVAVLLVVYIYIRFMLQLRGRREE
ncbi:MAG: TDT family transporter [Mogibacterium sp.]|nr:TDT family transporter [Mogibacterium sp.]